MRIIIYTILILLLSVSSGMTASISDYTANTSPASGDLVVTVDVSDTTMASSGTNKKVTLANLISNMMKYGFAGATVYPTFAVLSGAGGATLFQVDHSGVSMIVVEMIDENASSGSSNEAIFKSATGIEWLGGSSARTAMGLAIGSDVQAYDAGIISGDTNAGVPTGTWDFTSGTATISNANILTSLGGTSDYFLASTGTDGIWINPGSARTALALVIGTNVQAYNADLDSLSGVGNDKLFYSDGAGAIQEVTLGASGLYLLSQGTGSAPTWGTGAAIQGGSGATWYGTDSGTAENLSGGTIWMKGREGIETVGSGNTIFFELRADGGVSKYFVYSGVTVSGDMMAGGIIYWDSTTMGGVTLPTISGSTPIVVIKDISGSGITIFTENAISYTAEGNILYNGSWGTKIWLVPDNLGNQISLTHVKTGTSSFWDAIGNIGSWTLE